MYSPLILTIICGLGIRIWLSNTTVSDWLGEENEVTTPLTSWKRVTEGLALHRAGISPYLGDIFHETPLMLRFLNYCSNLLGDKIYLLFVLGDFVIAVILNKIANHHGRYLLVQQTDRVSEIAQDCTKLLHRADSLLITRFYVFAAYMFNPFAIAVCLAKSTAVFNNLAVAAAILFTVKGWKGTACLFIALAAYLSLYPVMLIVPAALYFAQIDTKNCKAEEKYTNICATCMQSTAYLLLYYALFMEASFLIEGSWRFVSNTYGFILTVPDLTPNSGIFWYFFTEMFEHFRMFFICVFQINVFIYTVPLAVRLKEHPIFLMYLLVTITAIFKSYPSYGDAALYLSLLPLWKFVFPYMRNNFVVAVMFCVCAVFSPILYHLWIYAGSANANFYFAITLVYTTAQVFLATDLLFGFLRREYDVLNGMKRPEVDGKPVPIILD